MPAAKPSAASKKCKLSAITNPILNGLSIGLTFGPDGLQLCSKTFNCCGGLGWQDTDGGVKLCQLQSRFSRVLALEKRYNEVWGATMPFGDYLQWLGSWDLEIIKTVSSMHKGYSAQCRLIENSPLCIKGKPSACWAMALVAIWRFGKAAEVVPFHQLSPHQLHALLPRAPQSAGSGSGSSSGSSTGSGASSRQISNSGFVLVEKISGLHREDKALWLEYLVHYAYSSNIFLILEVPPQESMPVGRQGASAGAAAELQRRMSRQQPKAFYEHLDRDCQSKLFQMQREPNPRLMSPISPNPSELS